MNRVNKENVVNETGSDGGNDTERGETDDESVDLGIGIDVDIDLETDPDPDTDVVELEFDEDEDVEGTGTHTPFSEADGPQLRDDERDHLEAADVDPEAIRSKEYSYRMLLDADVDEAVADELRRRFSLPWSFDSDGDLERRSSEVRGLGDAEREWIAVSGDENWQAFEYQESPLSAVGRDRPSTRPYPKPTPVTAVTGVGPDDADKLAEAGVRSAERLATVDAFDLAKALDLDVIHVRTWRHNARELLS